MGEIVPFAPADFASALKRIRELWERGAILVLPHAKQRMLERSLDELDLQNLIRTGRVTQQTGKRFKIVGKSVEEDIAACIVEIEGDLIVVTVMYVRKKGERRRES